MDKAILIVVAARSLQRILILEDEGGEMTECVYLGTVVPHAGA